MDEDDINDMHPVYVDGEANALARRRGLDADRVRAVFYRLREVGWLAPRFPWNTALDEAFEFLPPSDALALFESEDLGELARRVALVEYLAHEFTPLYTLGALAGLTRDFTSHLERNREHLLLTGHPKTNFAASPFLDWHLTRLCFTKLPLTVQGERAAHRQAAAEEDGYAERDEQGNLIYSYTWAREPPEYFIGRSYEQLEDGTVVIDLPGYWWRGGPTTLRGEPVHVCSYEDAALAPGLRAEDATRLEGMRRKLLDVRIGVVCTLSRATPTGSASGLEDECFALLTGMLTYEEAQFLLSMDEFYQGLHGTRDFAWSPMRPMAFHSSGLGDLLDVIGHFGKEVAVGTMHRAAHSFREVMGGSQLPSYYQIAGSDARAAVDALLDGFLESESSENSFLAQYRMRVNDLLQNRLGEDVTVSLRVGRGQSRQFRSMLGSFADFLKAHVEMTGEFPKLSLSSPEPDRAEPDNAFQWDGDGWLAVFNGIANHHPDTVGMRYLHQLLAHPGRDFKAMELARLVDGTPAVDTAKTEATRRQALKEDGLVETDLTDAGEIMDEKYRKDVKAQLSALDNGIASARLRDDITEEERLEEEKDELLRFTAGALGLGGKKRKAEDPHEKARQRAGVNIRRAKDAIGKKHPALQAHLQYAVKTGYLISYKPDRPITWVTD